MRLTALDDLDREIEHTLLFLMNNMLKKTKRAVKGAFNKIGLEISFYRPPGLPPPSWPANSTESDFGINPYGDISKLINQDTLLITFDVGANIGQTVAAIRGSLPDCEIHSFEPSPTTYRILKKNTKQYKNLR